MGSYIGVKVGPVGYATSLKTSKEGRSTAKFVVVAALVLAVGWQLLLLLPPILLGLFAAYWIVWRPVVAVQRRRGEDPWTVSRSWRAWREDRHGIVR